MGVTAKMSLSLSIPGHILVMESLKLSPRVKAFKEENDSNNLTLGPSLRDSITKVWPEIERLSHIFAVTPFSSQAGSNNSAGSNDPTSLDEGWKLIQQARGWEALGIHEFIQVVAEAMLTLQSCCCVHDS